MDNFDFMDAKKEDKEKFLLKQAESMINSSGEAREEYLKYITLFSLNAVHTKEGR